MINVMLTDTQTIATAYPTQSTAVNVKQAKGYSVEAVVTVNTPGAQTFTADSTTDKMTAAGHGMLTGLVVQVSTSTTLPAPLATSTPYYVIPVDANTFKLATSLANAQNGVAIDLTTNGTGVQTVTPTALATASAKLQASNDNVNWVDIANTSTNITATGNIMWNVVDPMYDYVQVAYTLASGQYSSVQTTVTKSI